MAAYSRPYRRGKNEKGATCMCSVECMIIGSYGDELPSRLGAVPMKAARFIRESSFLHGVHEDFREIQDKIRSDPSKELVYAYPVFPGIRKGTSELKPRAECVDKIEQLLKKCRRNGALIWYMGHGQKNTGNWCFKDGEITLDEIIKLYSTYFSGKLLYLISDCCYSGQWVRRMADIMDHWKVETCGHQAKRRNALIKVAASCQPDELASDSGIYTKYGVISQPNGTLEFCNEQKIDDDQTTMFFDFTEIRCGVGPSSACMLPCLPPSKKCTWIDLLGNESEDSESESDSDNDMVNLGHQFQNFHLHSQQPATTPTYNSHKQNQFHSPSMSTQFYYQSSATMSTYSQQSWQGMHYHSSYGGQKMTSTVSLSACNGSTSVLMSQSSVSLNF